jgi:hypothetical protein
MNHLSLYSELTAEVRTGREAWEWDPFGGDDLRKPQESRWRAPKRVGCLVGLSAAMVGGLSAYLKSHHVIRADA